ncbi:MAG: DUF3037 domain-containing protein [Mucilaginibacter sp.]
MKYFDYSIIRYLPDKRRGEFVNIGVLIYHQQRVETYLLANLAKARHLDASLSIKSLDELPELFSSMVKSSPNTEHMYSIMSDMGPLTLSQPGYFVANTPEEYSAQVRDIMRDLVTPKIPASIKRNQGRLITELKRQYQKNKLLAEFGEDITHNHLVATSYQLADESELTVDFAQKNGRWHVTQTVDYKIKKDRLQSKFKEVGIKAIGLDQALKYLGNDSQRFCIIDVPDEYQSVVQGQINLLSEYADHILNYSSNEDMAFYWENAFKVGHIYAVTERTAIN